MRITRIVATVALLLFVGATVGMLIAQEVSQLAVAEDAGGLETALEIDGSENSSAPAEQATGPPATTVPDVSTPPGQAEDAEVSTPQAQVASEIDVPLEDVSTAESESESPCWVDAIYFHNTLRCYTCKNIEAAAKAVLEVEFADELADGRLRWSAVNMEKERQYVDQYDLVMPTLILVRSIGNAQQDWVALDETWSLIRHESRFSAYVDDSTRAFLERCP